LSSAPSPDEGRARRGDYSLRKLKIRLVRAVRERSRKLGKWHTRWYPPEGPSSGGSLEPLPLEIVRAIVRAPEARGASFCRFRRGRCGRDGFSCPKFSFCLYGLRGVRSYRHFRRARCTDGLSVLSATVATARRFPENSTFASGPVVPALRPRPACCARFVLKQKDRGVAFRAIVSPMWVTRLLAAAGKPTAFLV
jgi:hypothetical protein